MTFTKKVLAYAVSLAILAPLNAAERPSIIEFVRPLGMGGAFTAVADDHNIFNFNPAGMVQRTGAQVTMLEIAVGGSEDLKDAYDFIDKNKEDLEHFETLDQERQQQLVDEIANDISKLNPRLYVAADVASYVSGPTFLGLPMHVGFGGFGVGDATFHLDTGVLVPNISYEVNNDIVLPLSIAHRWNMPIGPGRIGVGLTGKFIRRSQIKQERVSVLQVDDIESPPVATGHGIGADLGLLYQPTNRTNIGVMVRDVGGTKLSFDALAAEKGYQAVAARDGVIRPQVTLGMSLMPKTLLWLLPTNERWTFSADLDDVMNDDEHVLFEDGFKKPLGESVATHVHLGAEFRYWFLRFRAGANQGYPTLGLGLDIPVLKIDYAYYSRELGKHAGDIRETNHIISLALRFGSGATESRERIKNAKESKKSKDAVAEPESGAPVEAAPASNEKPKLGDDGVPQ